MIDIDRNFNKPFVVERIFFGYEKKKKEFTNARREEPNGRKHFFLLQS